MRRTSGAWLCLAIGLSACGSGRIKEQKAQLIQLEQQAASLEDQVKKKEAKISEAQAVASDLEAKVKELNDKLSAAQSQIDSLQKSNKDLSQAIEASKGDLTNKLKELVSEKDQLAKKLNEIRREKSVSERQRANVETKLAALKLESEELGRAYAPLKSQADKAAKEHSARMAQAHEDMGEIADSILKEIEAEQATIRQNSETIELSLQEALLFEPQQAKITDKGTALLDRLGAALRKLPHHPIRVQGHSDNAPIKWELFGRFTSHWDLSAARATAVARYLHEHSGLDPHEIAAEGFGEFRPIKSNDSQADRTANRRIVMIVEPATAGGGN